MRAGDYNSTGEQQSRAPSGQSTEPNGTFIMNGSLFSSFIPFLKNKELSMDYYCSHQTSSSLLLIHIIATHYIKIQLQTLKLH